MKRLVIPVIYALAVSCNQASSTQQTQDSVKTDPVNVAKALPAELSERDTVTIGNVLYNITDIGQAEFDAVPGYNPSEGKEEEYIKKFPGKVSRTGDSLLLKWGNDSVKVLKNNNNDNEDYVNFVFVDYILVLNAYLVFNAEYESHGYDLYDAATGEVTGIIGAPQFSPDKRFFVCSNSDLVAAFTTNGFELFSSEKYKTGPVQQRQPESWGPVTIKWKDANSFVARFNELSKDMEQTDRYVKLVPR